MTSHSDYTKTREPKPMQVWIGRSCFGSKPEAALVHAVDPAAARAQVGYYKLSGLNAGKTYWTDLNSFTRLYQFSH